MNIRDLCERIKAKAMKWEPEDLPATELTEPLDPRIHTCPRCGEDAIEDDHGWAWCPNTLCNNGWTVK